MHMLMDVHFLWNYMPAAINSSWQLHDYLLHWSMDDSEHNWLSYYPIERLTSSLSIPYLSLTLKWLQILIKDSYSERQVAELM